MANLTQTLLACQNPDPSIRSAAEQTLQQAESSNLPEFFLALATALAAENTDPTVRQLAGIHFKNLLTAKDETLLVERIEKWKAIPAAARAPIKSLLVSTLLSSEKVARHTSAQASAEVASIELPFSEWPEFLPALMSNVTSASTADPVKVSTLECLGFTCERLASGGNEVSQDVTDKMLTTIVDGIRSDRPDDIRLSAAHALCNSLVFTRGNMENIEERNVIMKTVCEATQSPDVRVRAAAYECIVQIAFQYYDKLQDYMQTLFQLTFGTIKSDEEPVALQALEFWSTLCEEEMALLDEMAECAERGEPLEDGRECVKYVAAALPHLIPLLTETLTKQDEELDADEEAWNLSMAGATCLGLIANTVEDLVVPFVMPFVQTNINSTEWRLREAATMGFSSILEGPGQDCIGPFVNQSIPLLLNALGDPHIMVKDTTAWTLGRICEYHVRAIPTETFPTLVEGLMGVLMTETPRVSSQACFALHNLAAAFEGDQTALNTGTNALSRYMSPLLQTLLQVSDREGSDESNLRVSAFEAVNVLIQQSAPDCKPILLQLLPAIIDRLNLSFSMPVLTNEDREIKESLQGLLCGVILVTLNKLTKEDVLPIGDVIMTNLLQVLQAKNATAHEEAFLVVGAVADILDKDFEKYVPALQQFLMMGLQNFEAYQVCSVAVGVVGDISRAIDFAVAPYCDEIMSALMQSLQNPSLHRSVKPPVLSCFGEIALAIGAKYEPYLQISLMMLLQASQTRAPEDDEELVEYVNVLREGILEAYTGVIQGLKEGGKVELLLPYVDAIVGFLEMLSNDPNRNLGVTGKSIGVIGDLASSLGSQIRDQINRPYAQTLIQEGMSSGDETVRGTAHWASQVIIEALQSS